MSQPFTITGTVNSAGNSLREGLRVRAFDRDLPSRERRRGGGSTALGEGITDAEGRFALEFEWERIVDGEVAPFDQTAAPQEAVPNPDVSFQVYDQDQRELVLREILPGNAVIRAGPILFNVGSPLEVSLTVELPPEPAPNAGDSELELLLAGIAPALGELALGDLADDDLTFLSRELGEERRRIKRQRLAFLRAADLLSRASGLTLAAFYGWARTVVPELWQELPSLDDPERRDAYLEKLLEAFAATEAQPLAEALRRAAAERIIPTAVGERAEALAHAIRRRGLMRIPLQLRLVSQSSGEPLRGYRVTTLDSESGRDLGEDLTGHDGGFEVAYYADPREANAPRPLRFQITGAGLPEPVEVAEDVTPPARQGIDPLRQGIIAIRVPIPDAVPTLQALAENGALELSADVLDRLGTVGVRSYADIRRRGGLAGIRELADLDAATVRQLDALADLDRLTPNSDEAATLLQHRYESVAAIADAPWGAFLAQVAQQEGGPAGGAPKLAYDRAVGLRAAAEAQRGALDMLLAGYASDLANGFKPFSALGGPFPVPSSLMDAPGPGVDVDDPVLAADVAPGIGAGEPALAAGAGAAPALLPPSVAELLAPHCGCEDCEAAVSPGAYLATLLDYAAKHVQNGDAPLTAAYFAERFHQPLGDLPLDCEAANRSILQARIAVEVLRAYVGVRPLLGMGREVALQAGEAGYRLSAYVSLLAGMGASYEEIRRARTGSAEERASLAERLGIPLTPPLAGDPRNDELDQLFRDPEAAAGNPFALTEEWLERIFGLADTVRDPLAEGIKFGDAAGQLLRWNFNGANPGRNTDPHGLVHLRIAQDGAGYVVSAFADEARTALVAVGARSTPVGPVRLAARDGSGLSGNVELSYTANAADSSIAVAPLLLAWRLARLRSRWFAEDWPAPLPAAVGDEEPTLLPDLPKPLVDPQVIGLADLRRTRPGVPAYDLWLSRVKELSSRRAALKAARDAAATPLAGLEAAIELALRLPGEAFTIADLDQMAADQQLGHRIEARLQPLGLSAAAFRFLMPILALARAGQPILEPEWDLLFDTLVHARKQRAFGAWRAAEKAAGITLSPDHFRLANASAVPDPARRTDGPLWLSTRMARSSWSEVLEARLGQEATVGTGVDSARNATEEGALTLLRDSLILASDAEGDDLAQRGEWLTRRLLLDMRMTGTHRTTRVAQSIETLQELLFRLRTGQLAVDNPEPFAILTSLRAVATGDGRTHLLARGDDGALWERVWDGSWRSWRSRGPFPGGGPIPESFAAVQRGNGLDVAVVGADRRLWHGRYESGWSSWEPVTGGPLLTGGVGLSARGLDALDAYVLRMGDLRVFRHAWDGESWADAEDVGVTSNRIPAAVSQDAATVELILSRPAPTLFAPLHRRWDGATWQDENLDSILGSDPVLVATEPGRLDLFVSQGGHLRRKVWNGVWQPWEDVDAGLPATDPQIEGTPSACSPAPGIIDVYAIRRDKLGRQIWRRRWAEGTWTAWEALSSERLELDAPQFDVEWEWVGFYASWRSAVFVRLYPDNLTLPSLAARRTPAFRDLVDKSRPTRRITPATACKLAQAYSAYLRDVSMLVVQASCQAATVVSAGNPCKAAAPVRRAVQHLFGRAPSGKVYWCTFDPSLVETGYAQSFWTEVPLASKDGDSAAPKIHRIVGALPWRSDGAGQHHLYLFVETDEPSGRKLKRARMDLDQAGETAWEAGLVEIGGLPPGWGGAAITVDMMTVVPVQSDTVAEAPRLAFHVHSSSLTAYIRPLNGAVDGFGPGDWPAFEVVPRVTSGQLLALETVDSLYAALRTGGTDWIIYRHQSSMRAYAVQTTPTSAHTFAETPSAFRGAITNGSSALFVFFHQDGDLVYQNVPRGGALGTLYLAPGVTRLPPHSGSFSASFFVTDTPTERAFAIFCHASGDRLEGDRKFDVVPLLGSVTSVPTHLNVAELQARRQSIRSVYQKNAASSETLLTYLREAYRLVPQQLGLCCQASDEFVAALDWFSTVYDYRAPLADRYIDYGLVLDASLPATSVLKQPEGWLLDPLNPHAIARTRQGANCRYAVATLIGCLNAHADAEFTYDSNESLVRARLLYDTALSLCDAPEFRQSRPDCASVIGALSIQPGEDVPPEVAAALGAIADELTEGAVGGSGFNLIPQIVEGAKFGTMSWEKAISQLTSLKETALATATTAPTAGMVVAEGALMQGATYAALLADPGVEKAAKLAGDLGAINALGWANAYGTGAGAGMGAGLGTTMGAPAPSVPGPPPSAPAPPMAMPSYQFCIPPNPALGILRGHAELGLRKLRSGRNIAGIRRDVPAYAAPTDTVSGMPVVVNGQISLASGRTVPPTAYRYSVLIARAKELAQQAAQVEALYLGAAEKRDAASYTRLKARQELSFSTAQVRLQSLRVAEANTGVKLAEMQGQRALIQQQTYQSWISAGLNEYETLMMWRYSEVAKQKRNLGNANALGQSALAVVNAAAASPSSAAAALLSAGITIRQSMAAANYNERAVDAERDIQIASVQASHERRLDEWKLQAALAAQEIQIGAEEVVQAQNRVAIVLQEKSISEMAESQARDTLEFLANSFTGPELYDWMSGVLSRVYETLLQQAASILNVARAQLAFERQETPPVVIRADYWSAPSSEPGLSGGTDDSRRGLTGSARLLADLYELDQYAFDTARRKLSVTKTFSLAQMAPAEFQAFRESGVIVFATPTELFDRDFPGHYLRLIRRVRTSVIALVPPIEGIRATLSTTGISRVVVGPEPFQSVMIRREPETVALTLPIGGTGVFEGEAPGEMYLPFEGNGVDSHWELRLPWAANRFDKRTLSDVLVTVECQALNNFDYGRAVIQKMKPTFRADRAYSFRNDFPDAWYDLHNAELLEEDDRLVLRIRVTRDDFPSNLERLRLEHVALDFGGADPALKSLRVTSIKRTDPAGSTVTSTGAGQAIDRTVSTRKGNGSPWMTLIGGGAGGARPTPLGSWEISLQNPDGGARQALEDALAAGSLEDILLVLSYAADTPPWPA